MATNTVGDFVVERMHQWGVRRIYGYPGDGMHQRSATLAALPPLLEPKGEAWWRESLEGQVAHWWRVLEARAASERTRPKPSAGHGMRPSRPTGPCCSKW
jgi:hypothetical protein